MLPSPEASPDAVPLSLLLRQRTGDLHRTVERSHLVVALIRGELPIARYCLLLRSLYDIYDALESALRGLSPLPHIGPLALPELWRRDAIASDLATLHGPDWQDALEPAAVASGYARRLRGLRVQEPARLVAHAYVRYLGDVAGGQLLARAVERTAGSLGRNAVRMYDFGGARSAKLLGHRLRAAIDLAGTLTSASLAIADEACLGFSLHGALFEELDQLPPLNERMRA